VWRRTRPGYYAITTDSTSADNSNNENEDSADNIIDTAMDAKFMADAEQEAEEERAAHAAFDEAASQRRCPTTTTSTGTGLTQRRRRRSRGP
jgi:molybdopterin biosynthesis enzyme MoaB